MNNNSTQVNGKTVIQQTIIWDDLDKSKSITVTFSNEAVVSKSQTNLTANKMKPAGIIFIVGILVSLYYAIKAMVGVRNSASFIMVLAIGITVFIIGLIVTFAIMYLWHKLFSYD